MACLSRRRFAQLRLLAIVRQRRGVVWLLPGLLGVPLSEPVIIATNCLYRARSIPGGPRCRAVRLIASFLPPLSSLFFFSRLEFVFFVCVFYIVELAVEIVCHASRVFSTSLERSEPAVLFLFFFNSTFNRVVFVFRLLFFSTPRFPGR